MFTSPYHTITNVGYVKKRVCSQSRGNCVWKKKRNVACPAAKRTPRYTTSNLLRCRSTLNELFISRHNTGPPPLPRQTRSVHATGERRGRPYRQSSSYCTERTGGCREAQCQPCPPGAREPMTRLKHESLTFMVQHTDSTL